MKIVVRNSCHGIALIIVMVSILVLAALAGGFAYSMKVETKLARNATYETELEWLGRSGVEYARWGLAEQLKIGAEPYDGLNQKWAGGPGGVGTSNSPLADISLYEPVTLGNGKFTITEITDCERKFNINLADQFILDRALVSMGVDAGDTAGIVGSILDWIDRDNMTHLSGTESDYYQGFNPPYVAKNGPIDDLSEMLLIKGVTPEVFWGPACTNHSLAAFQAKSGRFGFGFQTQPVSYPAGLMDIFAPLSSGRVNLNTASAETLQLIPGVDNNVAQAIVGARVEGYVQDGSVGGPFLNVAPNYLWSRVPGLGLEVARQIQRYCDVRSKTFEVHVEAEVSGYKRQFIAILGRNNPRDVQVLSFYWR